MHVHLPKPLHGWREFLGEVGIIVIGVGIALAAEQVVETWHWRKAAEQEKVSLDHDVATTWQAMDARRIIEPCVSRRLAELKQILDRHDSGTDVKLKGPIGRPTVWRMGHPGLDMASSDGTLAHLPISDRTAYFAVAVDTQIFERAAWEERDSWRVLDRLDHIDRLTPEDWREIHNAYENAADNDTSMRSNLNADDPSNWMWGFRTFPAFPRNKTALTVPQVLNLCRSTIQ